MEFFRLFLVFRDESYSLSYSHLMMCRYLHRIHAFSRYIYSINTIPYPNRDNESLYLESFRGRQNRCLQTLVDIAINSKKIKTCGLPFEVLSTMLDVWINSIQHESMCTQVFPFLTGLQSYVMTATTMIRKDTAIKMCQQLMIYLIKI